MGANATGGKKDRCESHTTHDLSTPKKQDADFEVSVAEAVDRRDMNGKVLNSVVMFSGSTDLSFREAAGDATFKFVSDLVNLGISIQNKISPTARAADVLDCFSIVALQWFLNAALANPIIARDAPLIVASPSRPRLLSARPP
jgi:hypothetical protein